MMTTFLCVKFRTWIAFAEKATPADTPLILIIKLLFDMSVFVQTKRVIARKKHGVLSTAQVRF